MKALRWFDESPDPGHPRCLCSWCEERIEEGRDDDDEADESSGEPMRLWSADRKQEARFHERCLNEALAAGALTLNVGRKGGQGHGL